MKCQHCGATHNTEPQRVHIGGQGEVTVWYCKWAPGCWARWQANQERAA